MAKTRIVNLTEEEIEILVDLLNEHISDLENSVETLKALFGDEYMFCHNPPWWAPCQIRDKSGTIPPQTDCANCRFFLNSVKKLKHLRDKLDRKLSSFGRWLLILDTERYGEFVEEHTRKVVDAIFKNRKD